MADPIPWSPSLQTVRARNHSSTSGGPVQFSPITPAPDVYNYSGRANQYGSGRRNGRTVRVLIVHETEGGNLDDDRADFLASMQYEAYRAEDVSCTCLIGRTGDVGYDVPERDRPFTTGRWNDESLTIEVDGKAVWSRQQWLSSPAQIQAVGDVLYDWCVRFDIPGIWLDAADVAEGASRQSATPKQGVNRGITDHRTANAAAIALGGSPATYSHTCPGDAFHQLLIDTIVPAVADRLGNVQPSPPTGDDMHAIDPKPRFDTRVDQGGNGPFQPGQTVVIPVGFGAVTECNLKVEVINPAGPGFLAIAAADQEAMPDVAALNYQPNGQLVAAQITYTTRVDGDGAIRVWVVAGATDFRLSVLAVG